MLKLVDILAIGPPLRARPIEADDAIRDLATAVEVEAAQDDPDGDAASRALVGVMMAAAAREARNAYPALSKRELGEAFAELAAEAFARTFERALEPAPRKPREAEGWRAARRRNNGRRRGIP